MSETMLAARLHEVGGPMVLEQVEKPRPRPTDVLIEVKACGVVPNLRNVLAHWQSWFPGLPLPELPAIFGLDAAGIVAAVGDQVQNFRPGDRVYVNPQRGCGSCRTCRSGQMTHCRNAIFQGYFGFGPRAQVLFDAYPYGGLCEFQTAPQYALVRLPDTVSFEQAARFGYIGTAYAGLRKAGVGPGDTLLINGISGTLGLGGLISALAMGVTRILGTGRNRDLLARAKAVAPSRIEVLAIGDRPLKEWVYGFTDGEGADVALDALGPGSPAQSMLDAIYSLRRGGKAVNVGGMSEILPVDIHQLMDDQIQLIGSCWFNAAEGQDLADMAGAGLLDLSIFEHRRCRLADVNDLLEGIPNRNGGFTNFVVMP